jgi:MFS family permease
MALTAFNAGAAGAPTMAALIVLRFFAGSFGSSPLTNAGGVIADMFHANERGLATALFAMAPFLGPTIGKPFSDTGFDIQACMLSALRRRR